MVRRGSPVQVWKTAPLQIKGCAWRNLFYYQKRDEDQLGHRRVLYVQTDDISRQTLIF